MIEGAPTVADAIELLDREADKIRWKHKCEQDAGYRRRPRPAEDRRASIFETLAQGLRDLRLPADAPLERAIKARV